MKKTFVVSTLLIALTLAACGKDKKPAATEPKAAETTEPAKTETAPADPNAPKPEEKKAETKSGW